MKVVWLEGQQLEYMSSGREIGWHVAVLTTDKDEMISWSYDMLQDTWEVKYRQAALTGKHYTDGIDRYLVEFKLDTDRDYMTFKLAWGGK